MTEEVTAPQEEEVAPAPGLNIQDLQAVLSIINIATKRGAFEANELSAIGSVHDKFAAFVEAARVEAEGEAEPEGEPEAEV